MKIFSMMRRNIYDISFIYSKAQNCLLDAEGGKRERGEREIDYMQVNLPFSMNIYHIYIVNIYYIFSLCYAISHLWSTVDPCVVLRTHTNDRQTIYLVYNRKPKIYP